MKYVIILCVKVYLWGLTLPILFSHCPILYNCIYRLIMLTFTINLKFFNKCYCEKLYDFFSNFLFANDISTFCLFLLHLRCFVGAFINMYWRLRLRKSASCQFSSSVSSSNRSIRICILSYLYL